MKIIYYHKSNKNGIQDHEDYHDGGLSIHKYLDYKSKRA